MRSVKNGPILGHYMMSRALLVPVVSLHIRIVDLGDVGEVGRTELLPSICLSHSGNGIHPGSSTAPWESIIEYLDCNKIFLLSLSWEGLAVDKH